MNAEMTFPHTFESGITILRETRNGAYMITDGLNVAFITRNYIRNNGTLTTNGQRALIESNKTFAQYEEENKAFQEKVARERREREEAWKIKKEEGAKRITVELAKGILMSASTTAYKYVIGRKRDLYGRPCKAYNYIPKSQVTVEHRNNKVYVTLPKWLAEKHSIFNAVA